MATPHMAHRIKKMKRNCFKCNETLIGAMTGEEENEFREPTLDAVIFTSYGNFGSVLFDPIDNPEEFLELYICDKCLKANQDRVYHITNKNPLKISKAKF